MLMSLVEEAQSALSYPELAGKRILITGLRQGRAAAMAGDSDG